MNPMPKHDRQSGQLPLILIAAVAAVIAFSTAMIWRSIGGEGQASPSAAAIGGPFQLTDQTGAQVSDQTYKGLYRLIYFGYTFCPDACPTELQVMAQALDTLEKDSTKVQPIFITIDPARDTVKQMAAYVPQFDKRLVGLTGTPQQIATIARAYKVYYAKADQPGGDPNSYGMNHSSFVYLMDPDGHFLTVFPSDMDGDKMATEIKRYMGKA